MNSFLWVFLMNSPFNQAMTQIDKKFQVSLKKFSTDNFLSVGRSTFIFFEKPQNFENGDIWPWNNFHGYCSQYLLRYDADRPPAHHACPFPTKTELDVESSGIVQGELNSKPLLI